MKTRKSSGSPILAVTEWLMVLPASVFLAAAVLRMLQPSQYEPARTSWAIFNWAISHISRPGATALFLGLPVLALVIGCMSLIAAWRNDEDFRQDVTAAVESLRQHAALALLTGAIAVAGVIFVLSVVHIFTD